MTELLTVVLAGGALLLIALAVVLPVLLALAFVAFVVKMLFLLVLLPFRALGWAVGAGVGALALLLKGGLLIIAATALIVAGLLPLLPVLLIGALVYHLVRKHRAASPAIGRA